MQERRGKLVGMRGTGGANVGNEREMKGKLLGLRGTRGAIFWNWETVGVKGNQGSKFGN